MPQMAPMWWTLIFMSTLISLMITMSIMYFNKKNFMNLNLNKIYKTLNWKW